MSTLNNVVNTELNTENIMLLIAENIKIYEISQARIGSDYRSEKSLTEAYNGRQLLEMLQNADDAQTNKVLLQLDIEHSTLTIANNGTPFDIKGLGSLMLANNSPKNKRNFIGNKGLGFRSILNWVDVVKIKTKSCVLEFSKEIARKQFEQLIPDHSLRQQIIDKEKELPKGVVPFAVLAIPDFKENKEPQDWETIVELKYKKQEEKNIIEQLETITPEVLLFLNHTTSIQILVAEKIDKEFVLTPSRNEIKKSLTVNEITWNLFDSGEQNLPNSTEKFYKYKIAWQDDLSDKETRFATYFPTQIATHLPYLIHATFDLDPTRNHLNKSEDNNYILNQIAARLQEIAIKEIINEDKPDWKALDFLTVDGKSENRLLDTFFLSIENAKYDLAIYPTLGGQYKKINEVKYYGNDFSEWVQRNELDIYFPDLLLPIPINRNPIKLKINSKYTIDEWKLTFQSITQKIKSVSERVKLIKLLTSDLFKDFHGIYLPLLIDDKEKPVSSDIETYILKKTDTDSYQIQDYVKIAFIHTDFYNELEEIFFDEIEKIRTNPNEHKSRPLKKIISTIVNFGSNDITDVVRNISRAFNIKVDQDNSKTQELVKPFINSLFQIFKQKKDSEKTAVDIIKVINRSGNLVLSTDVFLGKEYKFGKITETLFEGIFDDNHYLIGNEFWDLDIEKNNDYIDSFFLWLGVNNYSKKNSIKKTLYKSNIDDYSKFVFKTIGPPELYTTINYEVIEVDYFDKLISKKIEIEKFISWIALDKNLLLKLDNEINGEEFSYIYNTNPTKVKLKPAYFLYQITKSGISENIYVDFEFASYLGIQSVNPENQIFIDLDIDKTVVLDILKKLGAKMSFNDLTIDAVYSLLSSLKTKNIEHKNARKVYQQALNYFKNHILQEFTVHVKQSHLLASKNGLKEYRPTQEVYYSDNSTLPSKIIEDFWIFDFPKRSGEKQMTQYFGVKTFKEIDIEIQKDKISYHPKAEDFNSWFNKIKPYILTYRLNNINSEAIGKAAASYIKSSSVKIVSSLEYTINSTTPKELLHNEFINNDKHTFYIGADPALNLEQLKDVPAFCEAFSEIICVLFEVNENKDDFRAIFKDKEHLEDTKYLIKTKLLLDKHDNAIELLGIAKSELFFWAAITKDKIAIFPEILANSVDLQKIILKAINYKLPDNYNEVNFETFHNQQSFNFIYDLCNSQNISLSEIRSRLDGFAGLKHYHLERFKQTAIDLELYWNKACWLDLSLKPKEEQEKFDSKRKLYLQKRHEIIDELAEQYSWTIPVDYSEGLIYKLLSKFNVKIQKEILSNINLENKYPELISDYNITIDELSPDLKSLLFFEGHEEEIKTKFVNLIKIENETKEDLNTDQTTVDAISSRITSIGIANAPIYKANTAMDNKKVGTHSQKREILNKRAGKRAEKLVRDKLLELYPDGEIRWISGNSDDNSLTLDDGKGFDISYKKSKTDKQWKYLEVKSCSNGHSFIISNNEVTVGIENKENYHIAIVNGLDISFVEDFFLDERRLKEFNVLRNTLSIRPLDYEVYFIFDNIDNPEII